MADSIRIANRRIVISQQKMSGFWWNLVQGRRWAGGGSRVPDTSTD